MARLRVAALCALGLLLTIGLLPEHPPYVIRPVWRTQGVMDASSFRSAAQLLGGPGLYNPNAVLANQRQQIDQTLDLGSVRVFLRPPWYALAVKWMAWLPYRTAMALWKIGLLVGCALFVLLWRGNRSAAALAVCWSFPIAAALEQGQDTVWLLVLVAAALALVTRGRELSAGFVLSLCFIKFHLLLFLPLLLVGKRFRLAAGFVTGSTVLWAVSTVVQGPSWPLAFLRQLTLPDLHSGITAMPSVAGLVPQWDFRARFILCMVCAFPVGVWIYRISRYCDTRVALSASIAGALVVSPHSYVQDLALMIPFALIAASRGCEKRLAYFLLSPLATYPAASWIPFLAPAVTVVPAAALLAAVASQCASTGVHATSQVHRLGELTFDKTNNCPPSSPHRSI